MGGQKKAWLQRKMPGEADRGIMTQPLRRAAANNDHASDKIL